MTRILLRIIMGGVIIILLPLGAYFSSVLADGVTDETHHSSRGAHEEESGYDSKGDSYAVASQLPEATASNVVAEHIRTVLAENGIHECRVDVESSDYVFLHIGDTNVVDLSALRDLPLTHLSIPRSEVVDLSPLRGMPLKHLRMSRSRVVDLSPLRGMPLHCLNVCGTGVRNLLPLSQMSLLTLLMDDTKVNDLTALKGMALKGLAFNNTAVSDLRPVSSMPLRIIRFRGTRIRDITCLMNMPLRTVEFSPEQIERGIEAMRKMTNLTDINFLPAEVFWEEYDAGTLDSDYSQREYVYERDAGGNR